MYKHSTMQGFLTRPKERSQASDKKTALRRLFAYIWTHKRQAILAISLMFLANSLALVGPALAGKAIQALSGGAGKVAMNTVLYYAGLMALFYTASNILRYFLRRTMLILGQSICATIKAHAFTKFASLPITYFDTHPAGDTISRLTYDVDSIGSTIGQNFVSVSTSFITCIGSIVMMAVIAPKLMLVFCITLPLSALLAAYWSKKVRSYHRERVRNMGLLHSYAEEKITGQRALKVYHGESVAQRAFQEKNETLAKAMYRSEFTGGGIIPAGIGFVSDLSTVLVSVFGCGLYATGHIGLGDIAAFLLYANNFNGIVMQLTFVLTEVQSSLAAAERVFTFLDEKEEKADHVHAQEIENVQGNIELKNVSFSYIKDELVLKDIEVSVPAGSVVALVGHTGAGKTSFINLLMRFYDPQQGSIYLDKAPLIQISRKSLRQNFAMVLQDAWLFHGSIFANIAYGKPEASLQEVEEVAKAASLHEYIISLPQGYNTIIGDDGNTLSQGQKQLITIARAMLLDAKILILDEATANVDTITEVTIQNSMKKLMQDKTCFVIAHRLSTVRQAQMILVLDKGEIVERGTHEELLSQEGVYYKIHAAQI